MKGRKLISMLLALCMVLAWFPVQGHAYESYSGQCGDNVYFTWYSDNSLEIYGEGDMWNYDVFEGDYAPWQNDAYWLEKVTIAPGVTSVGKHAFYDCGYLTDATIPEGVIRIGEGAFEDCCLGELVLPESVAYIGDSAFRSAYVTSVSMGKNVAYIGEKAFSDCSIEEFTIDAANPYYYCDAQGVLYTADMTRLLGVMVLYLEGSYTIPQGVKTIDPDAFYWQECLTGVTFPDTLTTIGSRAFANCDKLTEIVLPDSVTSVGKGAFDGCYDVQKLKLSKGLTEIPEDAFSGCEEVTELEIPEGVTTIGECAFAYMYDLKELILPESLVTIGEGAFLYCEQLSQVKLGKNVSSIDPTAFEGCDELEDIQIHEANSHYSSDGKGALLNKAGTELLLVLSKAQEGAYQIPEGVVSFAGKVFSGSYTLTAVTIPGSVTNIPDKAFRGCEELTEVTLSEGIVTIGADAFAECSCLESVTIPSTVVALGDRVFEDCASLSSVTFLGDCPDMPYSVFRNDLLEVYYPKDNASWDALDKANYSGNIAWKTIGDNTETILASGECGDQIQWTLNAIGGLKVFGTGRMQDYAFQYELESFDYPWRDYADMIRSVEVGSGITYIGKSAFASLSNLCRVQLPDTLRTIGKGAFNGSGGMRNISLVVPEGVETIGEYAFYGMSLTSISLPSTLKHVKEGAFQVWRMKEIHVPDMETWMGIEFEDARANPFCDSYAMLYVDGQPTTELVIPEGTTEIRSYQFSSNATMTGIRIPNTVTRIEPYAFLHGIATDVYEGEASLSQVVFPESVTYIGEQAFSGHNALRKLVFLNPQCEISLLMYDSFYFWGDYEDYEYDEETGEFYPVGDLGFYISEEDAHLLPVIYGYAGSTAEAYAKTTGLKFIALDTYHVVDGGNQNVGIGESHAIRVDGEVSKFESVSVDGIPVSDECYVITEGSTIVTFTPEYLKTLETGEHSVMVFFEDGAASTNMTVAEASAVAVGDVNGDGRINTVDLVILRQYLANWGVQIEQAASDVNVDGRINTVDLVILRQYLANWDVTLG